MFVVTIMGGSGIRVPHGVPVEVFKLALMGGNDVDLGEAPGSAGGPRLRIRLISLMGGAKVRRSRAPELGRGKGR